MTETGGGMRWLREALSESVSRARGNVKAKLALYGYEQAARAAFAVVDGHTNKLKDKVKDGGKLSQQETFLLVSLGELKADLEQEFSALWDRYVLPELEE